MLKYFGNFEIAANQPSTTCLFRLRESMTAEIYFCTSSFLQKKTSFSRAETFLSKLVSERNFSLTILAGKGKKEWIFALIKRWKKTIRFSSQYLVQFSALADPDQLFPHDPLERCWQLKISFIFLRKTGVYDVAFNQSVKKSKYFSPIYTWDGNSRSIPFHSMSHFHWMQKIIFSHQVQPEWSRVIFFQIKASCGVWLKIC